MQPEQASRRLRITMAASLLVASPVALLVLAPQLADPAPGPEGEPVSAGTEEPIEIMHPEWARVPHDDSVFGGPGNQMMRSVTVWDGGVVAVGQDCVLLGCLAAVWTSPDGEAWRRVPHDDDAFGVPGPETKWMWSVIEAGPGLVAVGWDCAGDRCSAAVWISTDGESWRRIPHDESVFGGQGNQRMVAVTPLGESLVAVGWDRPAPQEQASAAVWTSPDGEAWRRVPHDEEIFGGPGDQAMWSVIDTDAGLVAVGYDGLIENEEAQVAVWTSPDGTNWSRLPPNDLTLEGPELQVMRGVAIGGPGLVAVGYDWSDDDGLAASLSSARAAVWTSTNGVHWSRLAHDQDLFGGPGDHMIWAVTVGGPGLVAVGVGADAPIWTSADGTSWERVETGSAFAGAGTRQVRGVAEGDTGLIAVGRECTRAGCVAAVWVGR